MKVTQEHVVQILIVNKDIMGGNLIIFHVSAHDKTSKVTLILFSLYFVPLDF